MWLSYWVRGVGRGDWDGVARRESVCWICCSAVPGKGQCLLGKPDIPWTDCLAPPLLYLLVYTPSIGLPNFQQLFVVRWLGFPAPSAMPPDSVDKEVSLAILPVVGLKRKTGTLGRRQLRGNVCCTRSPGISLTKANWFSGFKTSAPLNVLRWLTPVWT